MSTAAITTTTSNSSRVTGTGIIMLISVYGVLGVVVGVGARLTVGSSKSTGVVLVVGCSIVVVGVGVIWLIFIAGAVVDGSDVAVDDDEFDVVVMVSGVVGGGGVVMMVSGVVGGGGGGQVLLLSEKVTSARCTQ